MFQRPMTRIEPAAPAQAYQTYQVMSPHDRTVRSACEEVGCEAWRHGWDTAVDERTELGARQAHYIRHKSGRTFRELRRGDLTVFRFDSRQRCFADHQTRPEIYLVKGGDWRGNPADIQPRRHTRASDWVEDFGEHQQRLADQREKG